MRNDLAPFTDPRVRQAVAYTLDRPGMVSALLAGYGPSATTPRSRRASRRPTVRCPSAPRTSPRPRRCSPPPATRTASASLNTEIYEEIRSLAQVIKANAAKAGININLTIESQSAYYGKATFGNSDWLDGTMSLVDYGDRGVPNVFLDAPLISTGPWNAAHFKNPQYDALVKQYVAAVDLQTQKQTAGDRDAPARETPIIYPYWIDGLTASTKNVRA